MKLFAFDYQFQHLLKDLGLSQTEATVYATMLTIGSNPASIIAKQAKLNRSSCYAILDQLKEKGLIALTIKDNIRYFSGVEPHCLIEELKNKKSILEQKIQSLVFSISQMQIIHNPRMTKSPRVIFFDGKAGIRHIVDRTLQTSESLRAYASLTDLTTFLPECFPAYYHRRTQKKILVRALYPANKQSYFHKLRDGKEWRISRLVPSEFDFHMAIIVFDDKVAIISLKEMFGLIMQSKQIAESQKRLFDLIWQSVEVYDQKITNELAKKFGNQKNEKL